MVAPDAHPLAEIWPPARLRITTPRLELRLPTDEELVALTEVAVAGVHDPERMPFANPWTDEEPAVLRRRAYQWHAGARANFGPNRWDLLLVAFVDGEPAGAQDLRASSFAVTREAGSGSWLGASFQGRGLGTEMREALLHFVFVGLGADWAVSSAADDNVASNRVSEKCGYVPDGLKVIAQRRGPQAPGGPSVARRVTQRYRIDLATWEQRRRSDIELHGLDDELLALLGASAPSD